jgi:hypothetical protein
MFILGKEAHAQLRFLKSCSSCSHSELNENVVDCRLHRKSSLSVYRSLELPVYEDAHGRKRQGNALYCTDHDKVGEYTLS